MVSLLCGCRKDDDSNGGAGVVDTAYTIAVIYPLDGNNAAHTKQVAEWALSNLRKAQNGMDRRISLNIEWYDENTEDLVALSNDLRFRPDVQAVIGPLTSVNAEIVADRLSLTKKTMIAPCATSAQFVRPYAGMGFLWSLTEPDITQCEVLLTRAQKIGAEKVTLLACDNIYGETFIDWFAFQATELGLIVADVVTYHDESDREAAMRKMYTSGGEVAICVPRNVDDIVTMLNMREEYRDICPGFLFSDIGYDPELLQIKNEGEECLAEYMEGVTPTSDPTSAFEIAYKVHFGERPNGNEPQLYDAIMLAALGVTAIDCGRAKNMNDALTMIVATEDSSTARSTLIAWSEEGMGAEIKALRSGRPLYDITGATGPLDFDKETQTYVVHSVYAHWMIYNGRFIIMNYFSSDGSRRVEASLSAWNWQQSVVIEFENVGADITYPALRDNWALLIAGSETWKNYRHQADVLNMYQILRSYGFNDDHIVLIMKDDIANNPSNPNPGKVLRYDDIDLYANVSLDYNLDTISADDIEKILTGQRSAHLPQVIGATSNDNVLVFWSGHGNPGSLLLGSRGDENGFTNERMEHLMETLSNRQHHRKMLWLIETCYSASVAVATEAVQTPGVLMFTAANAFETSKADVKIDGVYRTNRFTKILTQTLENDPNITFRNLYYDLTRQTMGSHVMVMGTSYFDNLFTSSINEFLRPARL